MHKAACANFASGRGVRFLNPVWGQAAPINNHLNPSRTTSLAARHAYYVAAIFLSPTESAPPTCVGITPPGFTEDFNHYLTATIQQLNAADARLYHARPGPFDALIASLSIQAAH